MSDHAEFSPSAMGDKMKCHGRHLATLGMDNGSSSYADRGTEVHEFCDDALPLYIQGLDVDVPDFVEDWQEQCAFDCMEHVDQLLKILEKDGPVQVLTETQVSLGGYVSENFDMSQVWGTSDVVLWAEKSKTLAVVDYKTGVGVPVSPVENVQMMIYGLGAAQLNLNPPEKVMLCVSQPRIEQSLQIWEVKYSVLLDWLYDQLIPALVSMSKPGAEFVPGESQCRWCPISGKCRAQRDEMLAMFDTTPADQTQQPPTFSGEEIDSLVLRLPEFKQWMNKLEEQLMSRLQAGEQSEEFKLVRGKSNRKWVDEAKADTWLRSQKLKEKERYKMKLLSPAQVEAKLKDKLQKPRVSTNFNKLWEKPEGKLSYAKQTDPRPAVEVNKTEMLVNLEDLL